MKSCDETSGPTGFVSFNDRFKKNIWNLVPGGFSDEDKQMCVTPQSNSASTKTLKSASAILRGPVIYCSPLKVEKVCWCEFSHYIDRIVAGLTPASQVIWKKSVCKTLPSAGKNRPKSSISTCSAFCHVIVWGNGCQRDKCCNPEVRRAWMCYITSSQTLHSLKKRQSQACMTKGGCYISTEH